MVKILICGDLGNGNSDGKAEWLTLCARLHALQNSAHGPFAMLLVAGGFFASRKQVQEAVAASQSGEEASSFPMPCFAIDEPSFLREDDELPANFSYLCEDKASNKKHTPAGLASVQNLTVAWLDKNATDEDVLKLQKHCSSPAYRGCDLLLSSKWPRDLHHFLASSDLDALSSLGAGLGSGEVDVKAAALHTRPRYHVAGAGGGKKGTFYQRPPYRNQNPVSDISTPSPCTRFISLAPVPATAPPAGDKSMKYLHALSLEPIVYMSAADVAIEPAGTTDCPYSSDVVAVTTGVGGGGGASKRQTAALSEADERGAKRPKADQGIAPPLPAGGAMFFGAKVAQRAASKETNLTAPSTTATVLHLGGVGQEERGGLSANELKNGLPGCTIVRRPMGKAFAFATFESHEKALAVMAAYQRQGGITLGGRGVTVGWAAESRPSNTNNGNNGNNGSNSGVPPPPPANPLPPGAGSGNWVEDASGNRVWEAAAGPPPPPIDPSKPPSEDAKILFVNGLPGYETLLKASSVEAFLTRTFIGIHSVRVPGQGKQFAFVEFNSPGEAAFAWKYSRRQPLVVDGDMDGEGEGKKYEIAVSWAAAKKDRKPMMQTQGYSNVLLGSAGPVGVMGAVLLMPPSQDCRTLFLGGDVLSTLSDTTVLDTLLQQYFNKQYKETSDTKEKEEKEEFYRLRWGVGSKFAFIECRTHALASVVMNDRECSVAQSCLQEPGRTSIGGICLEINGQPLRLGWAKGKAVGPDTGTEKSSNNSDNSNIDCWFCLASPSVKTHLIVSISDHCYLALPRGGVHPLHCMVVPIECVPNRTLLSKEALREIQGYISAVEKLYRRLDLALCTYERAVRTANGKDHMQINLIPVPLSRLDEAVPAFGQRVTALALRAQTGALTNKERAAKAAKESNEGDDEKEKEKEKEIVDMKLQFQQLSGEMATKGLQDVVVDMPGGPYQEYFHISLPVPVSADDEKEGDGTGEREEAEGQDQDQDQVTGTDWVPRRYVHEEEEIAFGKSSNYRFPMQIGPDIVAHVIGEPQKAFWKNCLVSEEEEIGLAQGFRDKFADFDPA